MPIIKLTKQEIDKIEAPACGQVLYWDGSHDEALKGFGLRVTPTSKTFIVQGRVNGRDCRYKIGPLGVLTPAEARKEAKKLLGQLAQGIDLSQSKSAERRSKKTLEDVFNDYLATKKKDLRLTTVRAYSFAFRLCFYDWRNRTLSEISKNDVESRYNRLCEGWRAVKTQHMRGNGEALSSQGFRLLSSLYEFEIQKNDAVLVNPVGRLKLVKRGWSKCRSRDGAIRDDELAAFRSAIDELKNQTAKDYLLFLTLTGLRLSEACGLVWDEVDLKNQRLVLPPERTKNGKKHELPLTQFLCDMLKRRHENREGDFVFHGVSRNRNYSCPQAAVKQVAVKIGKRFSPHDLRRTFITASQRAGIHPREQSRLLNHTRGDITGLYIQIDIEDLRSPMEIVNRRLLGLMGISA